MADETGVAPTTEEQFDPRLFMDMILNVVADNAVGLDLAQKTPVLPSVYHTQSRIPDLYANERGVALLVYRNDLPGEVWWAEYDPALKRLQFVTLTGQVFDLGIEIHENVDFFLRAAGVIYLVQLDANGKTIRTDERKIVVRGNGTQDV